MLSTSMTGRGAPPRPREGSTQAEAGISRAFSLSSRTVTRGHKCPSIAPNHPALSASDGGASNSFDCGFYRLPAASKWSVLPSALISGASKNLSSFRLTRSKVGHQGPDISGSDETAAAPAAPSSNLARRCGGAGYRLLAGTTYYFRVHLLNGIAATGRGKNYRAITRARGEVDRQLLEMLGDGCADADLAVSTVARAQLTPGNRQQLERVTAGICKDMLETLTILDQDVHALKPRKQKGKAGCEAQNILERICSQYDRQFAIDFGMAPQNGAAAEVSKKMHHLLDAGVVLSAAVDHVSALVAQLIQDAATINSIAKIICNSENSAVEDAINGTLKSRENSCVQVLRKFGFLSLSEADHCLRSFDYLMSGLANPHHKLNQPLKTLTDKPLNKGGKDDIVNMIMSMKGEQDLAITAGWGRGLALEFVLVGYMPGSGEGYLGAVPYVKCSQDYNYQLKFSRDKSEGIKVSFGRIGKYGRSIGSNLWLGGKFAPGKNPFNLQLTVSGKIGRDHSNEDILSFTLNEHDLETQKQSLKRILSGQVEDPYQLFKEGLNFTSKHEKKKTTMLTATAGFGPVYKQTAGFDNPVGFDLQVFASPMTVGVSKDLKGFESRKAHQYDSKSGEHSHSEDSHFFTSPFKVTAGPNLLLRARLHESLPPSPAFPEAVWGPVANITGGVTVERKDDQRTVLYSTERPKLTYGGTGTQDSSKGKSAPDNTEITRCLPVPVDSSSSVPTGLLSTSSAPAPSRSRWAFFSRLLRELLKNMFGGEGGAAYGMPIIERNAAGEINAIAVDVRLPRTGKALTHPTVKAALDRLEPGKKAETRACLLDEISFTTAENRAEIKQWLDALHSFPHLNAKIQELNALAEFTGAGGWFAKGDRRKFRQIVKNTLKQSSDEGADKILGELLILTDEEDIQRWPVRGNGTAITLSIDGSKDAITRVRSCAAADEINTLIREPGFGRVRKSTIKETRTKTTALNAAFPLLSFASSASVTLGSSRVRQMPE